MKFYKKLLILIIILAIGSIFLVNQISSKIKPNVAILANNEANKITNQIIISCIQQQIANQTQDLYTITSKADNEVKVLNINEKEVNKLLMLTLKEIRKIFIQLSDPINSMELRKELGLITDPKLIKKGYLFSIALFSLSNNMLLSGKGIKIPFKFMLLSNVSGHIESATKSYGLNNVQFELIVVIKLKYQVYMPITLEEQEIEIKYPLLIKLIQGEVPNYYLTPTGQN